MVKRFAAADFPSGFRTITHPFLQESTCDRRGHQSLQNANFDFYEMASYSKILLCFIHVQSCLGLLKVTVSPARKCTILVLVKELLLTFSYL